MGRRRPEAKRFFASVWRETVALRAELAEAEARWFGRPGGASDRADFELIQRLQSPGFAWEWARATAAAGA